MMRASILSFVLSVLTAGLPAVRPTPVDAQIKPTGGQFLSEGRPVEEFHCEPSAIGKHPAVLLIHGCAPLGFGDDEFKKMCVCLAEHGYYAMFVEYYSRTGKTNCAQFSIQEEDDKSSRMPLPSEIWLHEITAAGTELGKNNKVDASRFGLIGFSNRALLAFVEASFYPDLVRAVVGYYGFTTPRSLMFVENSARFPPSLILQGDADSRTSVDRAIDLQKLLDGRGGSHEIHIYPNVQHAFNFHESRGYDPLAAQDSWARTLFFLDRHLK